MQRACKAADPGIVNQNVSPSEGTINLRGQVLDRVQVADVAFDDFGFSACLGDEVGGCLQMGVGAAANDDGGRKIRQFAGDGGANAASRAGDHRDLSAQNLLD